MNGFEIKITNKDGLLYEFISERDAEIDEIKRYLNEILGLYKFCVGDSGELPGYLTPELYKERKLKGMNKEELLKLKEQHINSLLLFAQDFHPDEVDCGVMRGPDTEWWFIDDSGKLGYITLFAHYIKKIDEVLHEKDNNWKTRNWIA